MITKTVLEKFLDRKILICLNSGFRYQGYIESLDEDMLAFRDKFAKLILIRFQDIEKIVEK